MGKPMYITLDALVFSDDDNQDARLVKQVDEDYKSKTFAELLEKMAQGEADEYNSEAYNAQEMQIASHVSGLLSQANSNPGSVQVYALSKDEPPQEINVGLNDKISDYNDRILKNQTLPGQSGEDKTIETISLTISDNDAGGLNRVLMMYREA